MKAVILCGGKGTRIRDVSQEDPKPMVPIGTYPIVWHIMSLYSHFGVNEFVLCLGYKGWKIKEYFLNYRLQAGDFALSLDGSAPRFRADPPEHTLGWDITFAETGLESMTGARVKRIENYVAGETFMLTYGDGVGNVDIRALLAFHKAHGKLATVTAVRPPSRFGELEIDDAGTVLSFHEKPQTSTGLINGGFFVFEPGVFDYLSADASCMLETDPLQNLAHDRQLMTFVHDGYWQPMDTAREYLLLNNLWDRGQAPWKVWQ